MSAVRITQLPLEALDLPDTQVVRVTQVPLEALELPDTQVVRITQVVKEILHSFQCPTFVDCPGITDGAREDGVAYASTSPEACGGTGTTGGARTGQ